MSQSGVSKVDVPALGDLAGLWQNGTRYCAGGLG